MPSLGNLDNEYTILRLTKENFNENYYIARHEQTQINYYIEIAGEEDDYGHNFSNIDTNILSILSNINNPYILRYIRNGIGQLSLNGNPPKNVPYIIYENAPRYDLFEYISIKNFSELHSKLIFKKIIKGVQAIHNANICHRDINPDNIIFDENYNPKIYGFYFCCLNSNNLTEKIGTECYTPPEVYSNKPYNGFKYDIFSLGHLLMTLVTGKLGFSSVKEHDKLYKFIINHEYEKYWEKHRTFVKKNFNLSESFKKLFVRMVAYNPDERPLIDEILNDEWMQEINNLNDEQMNLLENEIIAEFKSRKGEI